MSYRGARGDDHCPGRCRHSARRPVRARAAAGDRPDVAQLQRRRADGAIPAYRRAHRPERALNFNGFSDGGLTFVVPVGWQTEIDFRNHDGMLPHSAEIINPSTPLPVQSVAPAIPRAFTLSLDQGLVSEATDTMRFTAQPAGDYLIFCGVPGHGAAGMWIRFQVSASAKTPALLLTAAPGK